MKKTWIWLFVVIFICLFGQTLGRTVGKLWIGFWGRQAIKVFSPIVFYGKENMEFEDLFPIYCYQTSVDLDKCDRDEEHEEKNPELQFKDALVKNMEHLKVKDHLLVFLENQIRDENEEKDKVETNDPQENITLDEKITKVESESFIPHEKRQKMDLIALEDYETLIRNFYTIDNNTMAGKELLNVHSFMEKEFEVEKETADPQILIYHTHSQEAFADSDPNDKMQTVVGVGEKLAQILREEYGYNVLHDTETYDTIRDKAYAEALPALERILAEHPSIQVVIDLHRDAVPDGQKLVMDLDGKPTARFMFFNGLSRTTKTGEISYLKNDNLKDNLAFSFRMQKAAMEYYPGLPRKIYLKGYRYNMHLKPMSLLIELGAQNNTLEEVMNTCEPLAHILDLVIGKKDSCE